MGETFVVDASPLIFLSRADQLVLLRKLASRVLVPVPVLREIQRKGPDDPTVRALASNSWLEQVTASVVPAEITGWGLGEGESAVLAHAYKQSGSAAETRISARAAWNAVFHSRPLSVVVGTPVDQSVS